MRKKITMFMILILVLAVLTFQSVSVLALSNEPIWAEASISTANSCLEDMISKNISVNRANESFTLGLQLYSVQKDLVVKGLSPDYTHMNESLLAVCAIKDIALEAGDELKVFIDSYNEANKATNLSSFSETYQKILASFNEERFEETIPLIDEGYKEMLEIQAKQTALNVFYKEQARTLKNFIVNNWKLILIGILAIFITLFISWKTIRRAVLNSKMNHLHAQKEALNYLIKQIQQRYFKQNEISEFEYGTKLKRYKEMILDVERKIPLLKEEMARVNKGLLVQVRGKKKIQERGGLRKVRKHKSSKRNRQKNKSLKVRKHKSSKRNR